MMKHLGYRMICSMLAATLFLSMLPMAPAHAGMISTTDMITSMDANTDRTRIMSFLAREDVRDQLLSNGVTLADVEARIAALSDNEARLMAERVDQMPAGGANVLGILFSIFVILLVTDLLGLTNVFPFTNR